MGHMMPITGERAVRRGMALVKAETSSRPSVDANVQVRVNAIDVVVDQVQTGSSQTFSVQR